MSDRAAQASGEGSVTVVGTAHVSEASVREVEETIEAERPDMVAVELDEGRFRQMKGETPDDLEASDLLQGNTVFQFIAYWMLSYVQARLGDQFDIDPGADMMAAVDTAESLGIDVALVDRDIQTTIQRFWTRLSVMEKLRMAGALTFGITDPRIAGIVFGLLAGFIVGPLIGLFGSAVGVTDALLTSMTGGTLLALGGGYLLHALGGMALDEEDALLLGAGGGIALGAAGVVTGALDSLVTTYLNGLFIQAIGSLSLGLLVGLGVGVVAGAIIGLFDFGRPEEELQELAPEDLTDADVVSMMMEEFREFSPGGAEALIDERDAYIAHNLVGLRESGHHVVAVVGAGHREGIEEYLAHPERLPPMDSLTGAAKSGGIPWMKIVGGLLSLGFLAFFVLLAMAGVRDTFLLQLFGAWFVINGIFAFGLAKLAGARWSSAGVGGAVAWMTSVNPLLAPGWFTGYMELRHTSVNVSDINRLNEIISDEEAPIKQLVSDMFDVPLFRLIMVVAATNIGSMIASVLFAAYVLPLFAAQIGGVDGVTQLMIEGAYNSARMIWEAVV